MKEWLPAFNQLIAGRIVQRESIVNGTKRSGTGPVETREYHTVEVGGRVERSKEEPSGRLDPEKSRERQREGRSKDEGGRNQKRAKVAGAGLTSGYWNGAMEPGNQRCFSIFLYLVGPRTQPPSTGPPSAHYNLFFFFLFSHSCLRLFIEHSPLFTPHTWYKDIATTRILQFRIPLSRSTYYFSNLLTRLHYIYIQWPSLHSRGEYHSNIIAIILLSM